MNYRTYIRSIQKVLLQDNFLVVSFTLLKKLYVSCSDFQKNADYINKEIKENNLKLQKAEKIISINQKHTNEFQLNTIQ